MLSLADIRELKTKKARDTEGLFLVEGEKLFYETPDELLVQLVMTADFAGSPEGHEAAARAEAIGIPVQDDISAERFAKIADTKSPQGILAVADKPEFSLEDALDPASGPLVILADLQDPGNLGTIVRTAEAFGAGGILICGESADIYQPKVVRATMGSLYRVPHFIVPDAEEAILLMRASGIVSYAAYLHGEAASQTELSLNQKCAFIIGNESRGLSKELALLSDRSVCIPMEGEIESLNAAMAAGILLYEAWRQRRQS